MRGDDLKNRSAFKCAGEPIVARIGGEIVFERGIKPFVMDQISIAELPIETLPTDEITPARRARGDDASIVEKSAQRRAFTFAADSLEMRDDKDIRQEYAEGRINRQVAAERSSRGSNRAKVRPAIALE